MNVALPDLPCGPADPAQACPSLPGGIRFDDEYALELTTPKQCVGGLVFIGRDLDEAALRAGFAGCVATS